MRRSARPSRTASLAVALSLGVAGCARNPVTGKRELTLVSEEQEIQLGQQSKQEVLQSMPVYKDEALQKYVESVGMKIAKASERPNLPWSFTVLDDATVNAFALPGGPIFITRGILTYLNSEAELASVLGHEIGHVTARHSVEQMSKAQIAQLGLGIGSIFSESVRNYGGVAAAGLQMLFLKYGRDDERQADQLGFRYMTEHGYDPHEMAKVFVTLERQSEAAGGGRIPEWQSTHPDPGSRVKVAEERAAKAKVQTGIVARPEYLSHVGGVVFGEDPRQGYFEGQTFYQPEMRFKVTFPQGFKTANTAQAVIGASEKQDAMFQLTVAGKVSPDEANQKFFQQQGVKAVKVEHGSVGGNQATASYFEAQTQQGVVGGIVSFIAKGGTTFQLVGYTPAQALPTYEDAFRNTIQSFDDLNDPAKIDVQPAKVELVRVDRDLSIEEFMSRYPSTASAKDIAIINEIPSNGRFKAGTEVKRVVGGVKPR